MGEVVSALMVALSVLYGAELAFRWLRGMAE